MPLPAFPAMQNLTGILLTAMVPTQAPPTILSAHNSSTEFQRQYLLPQFPTTTSAPTLAAAAESSTSANGVAAICRH